MHGLRCDPALLGWTRLLDEWLVALIGSGHGAVSEAVCWDDRAQTLGTLADAATRVRSFAYRQADIEPTRPIDGAILRFELQGRVYCVAVDQHWPRSAEIVSGSASRWLEAAHKRARGAASDEELAMAAVFVTPRLEPTSVTEPGFAAAGFAAAKAFVEASRSVGCSGCAFSFPSSAELGRYRYGNEEHPGALLLVRGPA